MANEHKPCNKRPSRNSITKKLHISKERKTKTCLDKSIKTDLKYAIAWVVYVLMGSWLFILMEEHFPPSVTVELEQWTRFKELIAQRSVVEELLTLRSYLVKLCSHHSLNESFDDLLSESKIQMSADEISGEYPLIKMPMEWIDEAEIDCTARLTMQVPGPYYANYTMVDAIYYTMTLVTTIGFGHIYPVSVIGKMFAIVYALVGVPLTCILMAKNSEMLSTRMLRLYESARKRFKYNQKTVLAVVSWMFLSVGFIVFMFLPSVAFVYIEEWTYGDSLYFTFITLTTIGFGDFIAGYSQEYEYGEVYKIGIVIWIMLALGYWVLLLSFLQKAIKSNAKTLKRRFNKKKIAKQAEFLKHLITKAKADDSTDGTTSPEEKLHMMAIMVESLSRRGSMIPPAADGPLGQSGLPFSTSARTFNYNPVQAKRLQPATKGKQSESLVDRLHLMAKVVEKFASSSSDDNSSQESSEDEDIGDSSLMMAERKCSESPVKFDELMNVSVCVQTQSLPGFEVLVNQAANDPNMDDSFKKPIKSLASGERNITLPLRDVIGLVLTVASLEGQDLGSDCDTPSETSGQDSGAVSPSKKESLPLLKNVFLNSLERGSPSTSTGNYIQNTLSHYLEECDGNEEDFEENMSQSKKKHIALMV